MAEELRLMFTVDKAGQVSVEQLEKGLLRVDKAVQKSGQSSQGFIGSLLSAKTAVMGVVGGAMAHGFMRLAEEGGKTARAMDLLAEGGEGARKAFDGIEKGAQGVLKTFEAAGLARRVQTMGFEVEQMTALTATAMRIANATGEDLKSVLGDLEKALVTGADRAVRRYGISLKEAEAHIKLTKETDAQVKAQERLNAILVQAGAEYGNDVRALDASQTKHAAWIKVTEAAAWAADWFAGELIKTVDPFWQQKAAAEAATIAQTEYAERLKATVGGLMDQAETKFRELGQAIYNLGYSRALDNGKRQVQDWRDAWQAAQTRVLQAVGYLKAGYKDYAAAQEKLNAPIMALWDFLKDPSPVEQVKALYAELSNTDNVIARINELADTIAAAYIKMGFSPEEALTIGQAQAEAAAVQASKGQAAKERATGGGGGGAKAMTAEEYALQAAIVEAEKRVQLQDTLDNRLLALEARHLAEVAKLKGDSLEASLAIEQYAADREVAIAEDAAARVEAARGVLAEMAERDRARDESEATRLGAVRNAADAYAVATGQMTEYEAKLRDIAQEADPQVRAYMQMTAAIEEHRRALAEDAAAIASIGDVLASTTGQISSLASAFGEQDPFGPVAKHTIDGMQQIAASIGAVVAASESGGKQMGAALAGSLSAVGSTVAGLTGNVRDAAEIMAAFEFASALVAGIMGDGLGALQHGMAAAIYTGVAIMAGGKAKGASGRAGVTAALGTSAPAAGGGGGNVTYNLFLSGKEIIKSTDEELGVGIIKAMQAAKYSGAKI
jgi:hypothetical protein